MILDSAALITKAFSKTEVIAKAMSARTQRDRMLAKALARDHELEQQLAERLPWYLLNPNGSAMGVWNMLTALMLLFIAVFTPVEVALLPPVSSASAPLFILGRVVDAIFATDMALQFVLTWPRTDSGGSQVLETRWRSIAIAYVRGWFLVDLLSLGASAFDYIALSVDGGNTDGNLSIVTSLRVVRILRLIKLARLLKASRRLKDFATHIPTPRATVTIITLLIRAFFVMHWFGCILSIMANLSASPLDTWLATHGYCRPAPSASVQDESWECAGVGTLYVTCIWWSAGMLMGAPISMTPHKGPYPRYYAGGADEETLFTLPELFVVLVLKTFCAFEWVTVLAQFVRVYNELDPDTQQFRAGWDALNRFVSYFKVDHSDARQLRRYYVERAEMARAKSRKRVMHDFSPFLAEKFVWMLNKEALIEVPCFSLVVERLFKRPESGMERYLVQIALAMQPALYVPTERPPPLRLYIITEGTALYRGKRLGRGNSWGAEDVLMQSRAREKCALAMATTYLHVLWIGEQTFRELHSLPEYREAYQLTKMWATLYAVGDYMVMHRRKALKVRVRIGTGPGTITAETLEQRINSGGTRVVVMRGPDGERVENSEGQTLHMLRYETVDQRGHEIVREGSKYRVRPCAGGGAGADESESFESADGGESHLVLSANGGKMSAARDESCSSFMCRRIREAASSIPLNPPPTAAGGGRGGSGVLALDTVLEKAGSVTVNPIQCFASGPISLSQSTSPTEGSTLSMRVATLASGFHKMMDEMAAIAMELELRHHHQKAEQGVSTSQKPLTA